MTLTLLLDLDNTLLGNEMGVFLPAYLQGIAKHVAFLVDPDDFTRCLLEATEKTVANDQPQRTLFQVFESHFYQALGLPKETLKPAIDTYYAKIYPELRDLTTIRPAAIPLVEEALRRGYKLAIATNPLFPRSAVYQRLDWSGLSPGNYPFEIISSIETFHFAKPNPAYFAEVLAQMGWPEGPIVVAGDHPQNDIIAAETLGLAAFQIDANGSMGAPGIGENRGRLEDLLPWIDRKGPDDLYPVFDSPQAKLAILTATPAALDTFTRDLSLERLAQKPDSGEWSLTEILCHLRDVESEVNLPRLSQVIKEDNPFIHAANTDAWANERQYFRQNGHQALIDFTRSRAETLKVLNPLSDSDWDDTARHAIFGPTNLHELVQFISEHDRLHIQQIKEIL